ncbi:MAG: ParA family protein [Candidatus Magasanikbacteria bacterium]
MARKIAIFNQKGGVGKTTSARELGAYLSFFGHKTLLVDFDPQANATMGLGIENEKEGNVYHALFEEKNILEVTKPTVLHNFKVTPSSNDLAGALVELSSEEERERFLEKTLTQAEDEFDFILIDMSPSLSLLTINALVAADEVIIPMQCDHYSVEGLNQLLETVDLIKENIGSNLSVTGALITMYENDNELSKKMASKIREKFPHYVFKNVIPHSYSLAEAPGYKRPILLYDPQSKGALAYENLAKEIISQKGSNDI